MHTAFDYVKKNRTMSTDSILLEEFCIEPREESSFSGTARTPNSDLRKWVAENLKKQLGEGDVEEQSGTEGISRDNAEI